MLVALFGKEKQQEKPTEEKPDVQEPPALPIEATIPPDPQKR